MSPAHNKIFGAKFLSFERLETICLYTVCYAVLWSIADTLTNSAVFTL